MSARAEIVRVASLGILASRALRAAHGRALDVAGVFEQSFHLVDRDAFVAVGGPGIGNGPLNAVCLSLPPGGWRGVGVVEGAVCLRADDRIAVGAGLTIDMARATPWTPAPWPAAPCGAAVRARLAALRAEAAGSLPADGLARLVLGRGPEPSPPLPPVQRIAVTRLAALAGGLRAHSRGAAADPAVRAAITGLVGLGPGLTPSGDDVLAGAMLALHALGMPEPAAAIGAVALATGPSATTRASRAFLAAAADGHAGEAMSAAIAALLSSAPMSWPGLMARLDRIGHTSGWDTLAGAVLVLDAVADGFLPAGADRRPPYTPAA